MNRRLHPAKTLALILALALLTVFACPAGGRADGIRRVTFKTPTAAGRIFLGSAADGADVSNTTVTLRNGANYTVTVEPKPGVTFLGWKRNDSDTFVSTSTEYQFTVSDSIQTITAVYRDNHDSTYMITCQANPSNGGTVSGTQEVPHDQQVTVSAVPGSSYAFRAWTENGKDVSYSSQYTFTAGSDRSLTAQFVQLPRYTLTCAASSAAGGTVSGGGTYYCGERVTVSAVPNEGYRFASWRKNNLVVGLSAQYSFCVTSDTALTAVFERLPHYTVTCAANDAAFGSVTGAGSYLPGTRVTVNAVPSAGCRFTVWKEDGSIVSTSAQYSFDVAGNRALTAVFEQVPQYTIACAANDAAYGSATGAGTYAQGESVTVTAVPNTGCRFVSWNEGASVVTAGAQYSFIAGGDRALTAVFEPLPRCTITCGMSHADGGSVTITDPFENGQYYKGQLVEITAETAVGYRFVGWMEDGQIFSSAATLSFCAGSDRSLTAVFMQRARYTISCSVEPAGTALISGTGTYYDGDVVTLSATPTSANYFLMGWQLNGTLCVDGPTLAFTADADYDVVAVMSPVMTETTMGYTVTLNPNCSDPDLFGSVYPNVRSITLPALTRRDNPSIPFLGWAASANASTPQYGSGVIIPVTSNMTLYAVWGGNQGGSNAFQDFLENVEATEDLLNRIEQNGYATLPASLSWTYAEQVNIIANSAQKVYDGTPLSEPHFTCVGLPDGLMLQARIEGIQTDAGTSSNHIATYWIYNADGEDVTSHFINVRCTEGTLVVDPMMLIITTGSASKTYDGTPLTCPEANAIMLPNSEQIALAVTGSQTDPGSSTNTYAIDWLEVNANNYNIVENLGILEVTMPGSDGTAESPWLLYEDLEALTLQDGYYKVTGSSVTISDRIAVSGDVHLILNGYATLNAPQGIRVPEGSSLTISGTGTLNAVGRTGCAGIGGDSYENCGTVIIEGGTVNATGSVRGAGIGGGREGSGGTIAIYGGSVTAQCYDPAASDVGLAAGIGGGDLRDGGTITIYGGTVYARGNRGGAGIGGGGYGSGGTITIYGGSVTAIGSAVSGARGAAGIGAGRSRNTATAGNSGAIAIYGGRVTAIGGDNAQAIGVSNEVAENDSGTLRLGDVAVYAQASESSPAFGGMRATVCRGPAAYIEPCGHSWNGCVCLWCDRAAPLGTPDFRLPDGVAVIESSAFSGAAMTVAYVPDGCTSIGAWAFSGCTRLTQIRLPRDCAFDPTAFIGCTSLAAIYAPPGGAAESMAEACDIRFVPID